MLSRLNAVFRTPILALGIFAVFSTETSFASEPETPTVRLEWIDDDGSTVTTDWRSETSWHWIEDTLVLQTWFEVPKHLTSTLPFSVAHHLVPASTKGPFALSPDHVLFSFQLERPVELLRFDSTRNRFLRVSADYDKTSFVAHANCAEANPSLNLKTEGVPPFFISAFCRPLSVVSASEGSNETTSRDSTSIDIGHSKEVSMKIEPLGKIKALGRTFEITLPKIIGKSSDRQSSHQIVQQLAQLKFTDAGEVSTDMYSAFNLSVTPTARGGRPASKSATATNEDASNETSSRTSSQTIRNSVRLGLHAQALSAKNSDIGLALSLGVKRENLVLDTQIPVSRSSNEIGWAFVGWEKPYSLSTDLSFGLQATLLETTSRGGSGETTAFSPAAQAVIDETFTLTLAPIDVRSNLAVARVRAEVPIADGSRFAAHVETFLARTVLKGSDGLNIAGLSVGFTGAF